MAVRSRDVPWSPLRSAAREALRRRRSAWPEDVAVDVATSWEGSRPDTATVIAALVGDAVVRVLPDGRLLHVPATVEGRTLTTRIRRTPACAPCLPVDPDLTAALAPYPDWDRIPVRRGSLRGMAERIRTPVGAEVLVVHPDLLGPGPLLGVQPGPEGVRLLDVDADEIATAALTRALARTGGDGWAVVDRLLLALARDPTLCRSPPAPVADLPVSARAAAVGLATATLPRP